MNFYKRFRDAAVCVVLLALPFFFLNANLKDPTRINTVDRVVLQVSAPLQYVATQAALGVSGIWQEYVYLVDVRRENDRLRGELRRLREANGRLASAARENSRLRRMLQLRDHTEGVFLSAQVIAKEVSSFFRVVRVRLDRGERDRIRPGMPVLSADGLVGQIRRTEGRYSDVLLIADKTSAIDVLAQRSGARGMLKGTGDDRNYVCRLEYLARDDEVQPGDQLVTSGLGHHFPPSLVVGSVSKYIKREYGLYQDVEVIPAVNFSRLEEVLVMTAGSRRDSVR